MNHPRRRAHSLEEAPSLRDGWCDPPLPTNMCLTIVVMGASGDLAKKKTYPALFALYCKNFLPKQTKIFGYARSPLLDQELRDRLRPFLVKVVEARAQGVAAEARDGNAGHVGNEPSALQDGLRQVDEFLQLCTYQAGDYSDSTAAGQQGYQALNESMHSWEQQHQHATASIIVGRLLYLALPPGVYPQACAALHRHASHLSPHCKRPESWVRVILEKPFGRDLCTSEALANEIGAVWPEESLYRIDHYLGKELVQNMLVLRFANKLFSSWWNRDCVANVQITFKENFGTQGRGGYFDQYGIIRDVMQNHLAQVMALLGMESPVSLHPDDIRDEKVKLLRCVQPPREEDCILGQYVAAGGKPGYKDDETVPSDSMTPTFASVRLYVHNERWAGVPFIMKAGKALNERTALVRIQLKEPAAPLFGELEHLRNELVIRFQPDEAIYTKLVVKKPGLEMDTVMSELDLTYPERYRDLTIPDAYERLILDCIRGDQQHFVRRDELRAAWAIFTPLLHAIDTKEVKPPHPYSYGSRGPEAADQMVLDSGYKKTHYQWTSYEERHRASDDGTSGKSTPARRHSHDGHTTQGPGAPHKL